MTRIIPRRKGHFVIFLIVGIVLTFLLSYYTSYFACELVYDTGCSGGMLSAANSNAKLVFTNFCTYETKCETEGKVIKDGIYSGSLSFPMSMKAITGAMMPFMTVRRKISLKQCAVLWAAARKSDMAISPLS